MTPEERSMSARAAALTRWAKEPDPKAATQKMRDAAFERFLNAVDPDNTLPHEERVTRAKRLQKAEMLTIGRQAIRARRVAAARRRRDEATQRESAA